MTGPASAPAPVPFTLRLDPAVHRATMVAAAQAGLPLNQWIGRVLEAASASATAGAIVTQLQSLGRQDRELAELAAKQALRLLGVSMNHVESEIANSRDALDKMANWIQSWATAAEIHAARLKQDGA